MHHASWFAPAALSLACACGPAPTTPGVGGSDGGGTGGGSACGTELGPGERTGSVVVDGATRTYLLHVPPSYTGTTNVPLVIDWHGLLLSGSVQRNLDNYVQVADREGFIVVYPNGIDNAWNVGPCCTFSREVDDVAFARALVNELTTDGCIDRRRVYSVGYSMGGGMSYHLACNAGDLFAAIAPAAFDLAQEVSCSPQKPIPVISFRGTADPIVPYGGGVTRPPNGLNTTMTFLGAEATFEKWASFNQCSGSPVAGANGCRTYSRCSGGVEVTLCTTTGGGHSPADANLSWPMLERFSLP